MEDQQGEVVEVLKEQEHPSEQPALESDVYPPPNWVTLGKLSFPKTGQIAAKNVDVFVFQGKFQHNGIHPVTVKRARRTLDIVDKKRLKDINHANIVKYFTTEQDDNFYYIATEPTHETLEVIAQKGYDGPNIGSCNEILEKVTKALLYLHEHGILHGNINPQSIVIVHPPEEAEDRTPNIKLANFEVIGGREGWTAPEYELDPDKISTVSDVFSLGIVFSYMLHNGQHPFGPIHLQQSNILFGDMHLSEEKVNDPTALDLIRRMLETDPEKRISVKGVLAHPWFWNSDKNIAFIVKVADEIIKPSMAAVAAGGEPDPLLENVSAHERAIIRGYWKQFLTPYVRKLIDRRSYDANTLSGLLLAIRDKAVQYADQSPEVKAEFGSKPEGYWLYWSTRFPDLKLHIWRKFGARVSSF